MEMGVMCGHFASLADLERRGKERGGHSLYLYASMFRSFGSGIWVGTGIRMGRCLVLSLFPVASIYFCLRSRDTSTPRMINFNMRREIRSRHGL